MKEPSAPPASMFSRPRRGGRNSRRRRNGGRGGYATNPNGDKVGTGTFKPTTLGTSMPLAVSGRNITTFFRQTGSPIHKEWGAGTRYQGCSLLGQMVTPAASSAICFQPSVSQNQSDGSGGVLYYDLYTATQPQYGGRLFAIHPALVTRLQNECYNWGRFCFRSITIHSEAASTTNTGNGYVCGLTHDVSWPLNTDQYSNLASFDIAQLGIHANGSWYESFALRAGDFRGDRTWSTTLPQIDVLSGSTTYPEPSYVWPYIEASYQHCWAIQALASGGTGASVIPSGYVYISYVVDFYGIKSDLSYVMPATEWKTGPVYSPHPASIRKPPARRRLGVDELTSAILIVESVEKERARLKSEIDSDVKMIESRLADTVLYDVPDVKTVSSEGVNSVPLAVNLDKMERKLRIKKAIALAKDTLPSDDDDIVTVDSVSPAPSLKSLKLGTRRGA
jgi:hypothetical protein